MSRFGFVPKGRTAQHQLYTGVFDQIGQVGGTTRKLADQGLAGQAWYLRFEIAIDGAGIEFFSGDRKSVV